jgi:hypothetical protein
MTEGMYYKFYNRLYQGERIVYFRNLVNFSADEIENVADTGNE